MPPLILASSSPRRHELLQYLQLPFTIDPSTIDETTVTAPTPAQLAVTLALRKARDVAHRHPESVVIGADTLVEFQGQVLNKPHDAADAVRMLRLLSGNAHQVHSGVAVCRADACDARLVSTAVHMRPFDLPAIEAYVATGEPLDKAGAYAAQGIGASLVDRVDGSYLAVVGLPLLALRELLLAAGVESPAPLARLEGLERGEP